MASAWASLINRGGRDLLWRAHAETLAVRLDGSTPSMLTGVWKRVEPNATQGNPDNLGLVAYTGQALFVVKKADLPEIPGARAEIDREGETWTIRHAEPQDEWTWILHLSKRKVSVRAPR